MKDEAISYVQNQLSRAEARLASYALDSSGKENPGRYIRKKIDKYVDDFLRGADNNKRWVVMPGLRGVGKTTVLAQTYMGLRGRRKSTERLLYISVDEIVSVLGLSLREVLEAYERILGTSFEKQTQQVFLFIDEVQSDASWAAVLKSVYDRSKKVFICCTGSSAVSLQTNADVIRRAAFEKLFPMSFGEFQMIKNKIFPTSHLKDEIKKAVYFSPSLEVSLRQLERLAGKVHAYWGRVDRLEVDRYLDVGTLPFALHSRPPEVYEMINQLLEKIISVDVRSLARFQQETLNNIKRLLFVLAESDVVSIHKLTTLLEMNHVTLSAVLDVLQSAELLVAAAPYGANTGKVKKPTKYLFMSPAIRASLLSIGAPSGTEATRRGRYIEDLVALHLYREFVSPGLGDLSYDPAKGSADFILRLQGAHQIAIEVGAGEKGIAQVLNTIKARGCDRGIVISNNQLGLSADGKVLLLPIPYFLLM